MKHRLFVFFIAAFLVSPAFAEDSAVIYGQQSASQPTSGPAPTQTPSDSAPAPRNVEVPAAASPAAPVAPAPSGRTHVVTEGDTLWSIAKKYNVRVESIQSRNHLLPDQFLVSGQILQIPDSASLSNPITNYIPKPTPAAVPPPTQPSIANPTVGTSAPPANPQPQSIAATSPPKPGIAQKMMEEARRLANLGLDYNQSWKPSGAHKALDMDCSNTSRYLYWRVAGIDIGRTASDQYYYLHLKNKAWEVPRDSSGKPDVDYLRKELRVGDLLFWEHTYKPQRDPPITHVTVFLGKDDKGEWIMVGSQQNARTPEGKRRSGPGIYIFEPQRLNGGYRNFFGFNHVRGRFVAIGRPLAGAH